MIVGVISVKTNNQGKLTLLSFRWPRTRFVVTLGFVLAVFVGAFLDRYLLFNGIPPDSTDDFQLMAQAWNLIDHYYVDRPAVRHRAMTYAALSALTDSLGDSNHSTFLTPEQARKAGSAVEGTLVGIGVEIQSKDHEAVVVAPIEGSPAQQAGMRPGDVILQINGHSVSGLPLNQVFSRIAGEVGQPIALTVINPRDNQKREVNIERANIKLNNVSWQPLPGTDIAHVRIAMFSDGVTADLRAALLEIQQHGLHQIILDLRNNPGGALDEAVGTASQFVASGNVLWEKNAEGRLKPIPVLPGGVATNMPVAVLINGNSASDSEIVAGALHDAKRATLIGETTFGTGTVLSQFRLADGSSLLLAVEEWLTPNKRSFWHRGITPDVRVTMPSGGVVLRPVTERELTSSEIHASNDSQLLGAIAWLNQTTSK
jgi:carboxyl-terminal processing protease